MIAHLRGHPNLIHYKLLNAPAAALNAPAAALNAPAAALNAPAAALNAPAAALNKIDNKTYSTPHIQPYLGGIQIIYSMNCCEALDTLSFKWSSWDETLGPRQQPETIR